MASSGLPEGAMNAVEQLRAVAPAGMSRDALLKTLISCDYDLQRAADALLANPAGAAGDWADVGKHGKTVQSAPAVKTAHGKGKKGKGAAQQAEKKKAVQDAATRRKAAQAAVEGSKVAQASTPKPANGTKKARNAGGSPSARGSRDAGGSKSTPSSTAASVSKAATAPATAGKKARGPPAGPNAGVAPVKSSSPYDAAAASAAAATDAAVLRARDAAASARAFILAQFAQLRTAIAAREAALVAAVDHVAATVERQQAEQGSHLIAHVRSLEAKEAVGEPVSVPEEMQRAQTSHAERLEIAGRSLAPQALMSGWNPQSHGTLLKAIELYGSVQMPGAPSSAYAAQPAAPAPAPAPAQRKAPPQFAPSALATSGAYGQSLGVAVAKTLDDPAILMVGGSGAAASAAAAGKFASQKVASGSDIDEAGKAAMEAAAKQLRAMKA